MAIVSKIIEQTLIAGATSVTFTDNEIPNSLIGLFCSDGDLYPVSRTLTGTTLTVTYEPQSTNKGVALFIVKQGLEIVDNVTSTDDDKALSAKQGKVLKDLIDGFAIPSIEQLTDVDVENLQTDDILIYDAIEEKWINASLPSIPESINDLNDVDITSIQNGQILSWDGVSEKFINITPGSSNLIKYQATLSSNPYGWFTFVDENGSTLSPTNGTPVFASCFDGSHYYSGIFVQADANSYVFKVGDINITPLALSTSQLSNLTFDLAYIKAGE